MTDKTMLIILLFFLIMFIAFSIAMIFMFKSQRIRSFYGNLDDFKLVEQNVNVKYVKKGILILQYAISLPLCVTAIIAPRLHQLLYPSIMLFLCALIIRIFFSKIEHVITTEIEYRKFKKDKTNGQ